MEPLVDRIARYRDHGLTAIELGSGITANDEDILHIIETDSQFLVHNYFPPPHESFVLNLGSPSRQIRDRSVLFVLKALELVSKMNAPFYSLHAGFVVDPTSFGTHSFQFPAIPDNAAQKRAVERFGSSLKKVLNKAEEMEVTVLVENNVCPHDMRGKLILQTTEEFRHLFSAFQSRYLGILLDTGHLNVTAQTFGFAPASFVDELTPHIKAFHVSDNDGLTDTHQPVQEGRWILDVLRRPELRRLPIVIEAKFETVSDLCKHVNWLKRQVNRG